MRYWRRLLWLLPASIAVPLGLFVYSLLYFDSSAYFAGVQLVGAIGLIVLPNLLFLGLAVFGAFAAQRQYRLPAFAVLVVVYILALSPLFWSPEFWSPRQRPGFLLLYAVPGTVAGLLAVGGIGLLRTNGRLFLGAAIALLLVPVFSFVVALADHETGVQRACPPGLPLSLSFKGAETAEFTNSCGVPSNGTYLQGCTSNGVTVVLYDGDWWYLTFNRPAAFVTSGNWPGESPRLTVGAVSYGGYPGWKGSYSFDPGDTCSGTVDADLFGERSDLRGTFLGPGPPVHVSGHFTAPRS